MKRKKEPGRTGAVRQRTNIPGFLNRHLSTEKRGRAHADKEPTAPRPRPTGDAAAAMTAQRGRTFATSPHCSATPLARLRNGTSGYGTAPKARSYNFVVKRRRHTRSGVGVGLSAPCLACARFRNTTKVVKNKCS